MSGTNTVVKLGIGALIFWWYFGRNKANATTIIPNPANPVKPYIAIPPPILPPIKEEKVDPTLYDPSGVIMYQKDSNETASDRCRINRCLTGFSV
jgi:hypothetical protein